MKAVHRSRHSRRGALKSWAQTEDWHARIEPAQANSPRDWPWHARRLGLDPATCTPQEQRRAELARLHYFSELAERSQQARRARKAAAG